MKTFTAYNEPFQNRESEPDAYQNAFGDALEMAFASGLTTLPEIVRFMNEASIPSPEGEGPREPWTEESFALELERLAA